MLGNMFDLNRYAPRGAVLSWALAILFLVVSSLGGDDRIKVQSTRPSLAGAGQLPCTIQVLDEQTQWPVPMVELKTVHNVRLVSDNAGLIAFDLPELMGQETWFHVIGHGYEVAKDGFGYRGVRLTPQPGETLTVRVNRQLPAKRLGRLTGSGIYAESQKLGLASDWSEQRVLGCDSVQLALHRGRLHWAWGDTLLANYPLGRFHMIGATTALRPLDAYEPPLKLRYDYFTDASGMPRNVGEMPGSGPTWISGVISLPDPSGTSRLVGTYVKIEPPLTAYELGLCVWDDVENRFVQQQVIWKRSRIDPKTPAQADAKLPLAPEGHPVLWEDAAGMQWVLFGDPFPRLRCKATFESWGDPAQWQPLIPQELVKVRDEDQFIEPHRGSIAWNAYRQRWVTVFTQMKGQPSLLGEIWYAESDHPQGPWEDAIKVVTHENYTFYNPRLHPELTNPDSPTLLFEGTYTKEFSGNAVPTPRYDYNQILYRLDLDESPWVK